MTNLPTIIDPNLNPYTVVADEIGGQQGKLLKFSKGVWSSGDDDVAIGTEFRALVSEARTGWLRWRDGRPVEHRLQYIRDGLPNLPRDHLGHSDESLWETDKGGKRRDPWQPQFYLPMVHTESGEAYLWAFNSHGARQCFAKLCRAYGGHRNANVVPVVSLQAGSYKHAEFGRIAVPDLRIEHWDSTDPMLPSWDGEVVDRS